MPQLHKNRPFIMILILSILLIALIVVTSGNGNLTPIEGLLGEVVTPVQKVVYGAASSVTDFFTRIGRRRDLEKDYELLKEQNAKLQKELLRMEEIEKENRRLSSLLQFTREKEELMVTGARVTGKNPGSWFEVFTIDKGKNQGVRINMAVVNDSGLIGRIIETGENWSKVLAIVDAQSSVSAIIERTRDNGLVKGSGTLNFQDGLCKMIYLPIESDVVPGDRVITSGFGGIFPKGIYIGEVKQVIKERRDLYKTAIIKPAADFQRLEEVLIVTAETDALNNE